MGSCTTEEMKGLTDTLNKFSTSLFDSELNLRKLCDEIDALPRTCTAAPASARMNVRLAKLDTPKFDGEVIHWRTFWDQFKIFITNDQILTQRKRWHIYGSRCLTVLRRVSSLACPTLEAIMTKQSSVSRRNTTSHAPYTEPASKR